MRSIAALALPLLFISAFSACKHPEEPSPEPLLVPEANKTPRAPADAPKTVALVLVTIANPFFVLMEKGARRAESELGVRLRVATAPNDISGEQQTASLRQLVQDGVDAIVLVPGHSKEMVPVVKEALAAGVVVVNIDNRLDQETAQKQDLTGVPFIGVDNEQGAYLSAKYLGSKLSGPSQVAIIGGDPTSQASQDRERGALRAFAERGDVEVVARELADWKIDEAHEAAARILASHPKISAIFCANDLMALGVIRYLEETQREDVLVAAYDNIEEARAAIRRGRLLATVDQRAGEQGYLGVQYAVRALAGEKLPEETFIDVALVTAETLQQAEQ
jgi:ribose transport system substrate-binding protein